MSAPSSSRPDPKPRSWGALALCIAAAALMIGLDLGSKAWAVEHLSRGRFGTAAPVCTPDASGYISMQRVSTEPKVILENLFELRYAENCGAAFGFLNDVKSVWKNALFACAAVVATLVLLASYKRGKGGPWFGVAAATITAGALGNFVDRVRLGYVVDFVRVYYRQWEYPTFNVADVAITVGVVAILIDGILEDRQERRLLKEQAKASAPLPEELPSTDGPDDASLRAPIEGAPTAESTGA